MSENSKYKVTIHDIDGDLLADVTGIEISKSVSLRKNDSDRISVSFNYDKIRALAKTLDTDLWNLIGENKNEIRIAKNGTTFTAGRIMYSRLILSADTRELVIRAVGWFELLGNRHTREQKIFTQEDAGDIAWELINDTQSLEDGDLGITQGTIQVSKDRDRTYDTYKNVKDLITKLSQVIDGFDFEITWDKVFNVYFPKIGTTLTNIKLTYPGNIKEIAYNRDGSNMANVVTALGSSSSATEPSARTAQDLTLKGVFGIYERITDYSSVVIEETLQEHADGDLRESKNLLLIPEIILDGNLGPDINDLSIGDNIGVVTKEEGLVPLNDNYIIEGMDWSVDTNNDEGLRLALVR